MKRFILAFIAALAFIIVHANEADAQKPDYEKYGKMAMAIVSADYPGEPITDYEYLGRKTIKESEVADTFRFKVVEDGKAANVKVTVLHNLKKDKAVTLTVEPEQQ